MGLSAASGAGDMPNLCGGEKYRELSTYHLPTKNASKFQNITTESWLLMRLRMGLELRISVEYFRNYGLCGEHSSGAHS